MSLCVSGNSNKNRRVSKAHYSVHILYLIKNINTNMTVKSTTAD